MLSPYVLLALVGLVVLVLWPKKKSSPPPGSELPPGPEGKPIVGNLLDIPPHHSWLQFETWAKKFGPLYRLNIAGRNHVIVSKESIANDLLRERGNIYSSREQLPMAAHLLSDNLRPLLLPYGSSWRNGRKLMHALCNTKASEAYQPLQEELSLQFLYDFLKRPNMYETWFERYSAGLILRLAYSKYVFTGEEDFVRRILAVVHTVERVASPGAYLVDTIPSLMNLPDFLAPFKREGKQLHAEELDLFTGLIEEVRKELDSGNLSSTDNFTTKWLTSKDSYGLSEPEAAYVIGTLFEAGAGTTAAAMCSFMLAMTLHPGEYEKLQKEVDSVVGNDRLPKFEDFASLPRVRAVAKEVLRWRPVTAGGFPHQSTEPDVYESSETGQKFYLPVGTNVHPVQWAIHRDPELYPRPEEFVPERWLEPSWPTYREPSDQYPNLQNYSAFGFGRRICPGQNIAERSLYILISRIAWACDIGKKIGKDGKAITPPEYDYVTGFNVQPKPFDFDVKPRHGREELVQQDWETVWGKLVECNKAVQTE